MGLVEKHTSQVTCMLVWPLHPCPTSTIKWSGSNPDTCDTLHVMHYLKSLILDPLHCWTTDLGIRVNSSAVLWMMWEGHKCFSSSLVENQRRWYINLSCINFPKLQFLPHFNGFPTKSVAQNMQSGENWKCLAMRLPLVRMLFMLCWDSTPLETAS